jgi:anti-sigma B factor antagonist
MPEQASVNSLDIEQVDKVTIVRFTDHLILTGAIAEAVSEELGRLLHDEGRNRLILNFGNVQSLTSLMLGRLITLNKKIRARGGRLAVCGLSPDLEEIFVVTKLNEYLDMHANEHDALQTLGDRR